MNRRQTCERDCCRRHPARTGGFRTVVWLSLTGLSVILLLTLWNGLPRSELGALIPRTASQNAESGLVPYTISHQESLGNRANISLWVVVPRDAGRDDIDRLTDALEREHNAYRAFSINYHCDERFARRYAMREPGYADSLMATYERIGHLSKPSIRLALYLGCAQAARDGVTGAAVAALETPATAGGATGVSTDQDDILWGRTACQEAFDAVNAARQTYNRTRLAWDSRLYELARERSEDMYLREYIDHLTPEGQSVADLAHWLGREQNLAESIGGLVRQVDGKVLGHCRDAVDAWLKSRGHRYNLLYAGHAAGALACHKHVCVFLGLNAVPNGLGSGEVTGNGAWFWENAPPQEGEV